MLNVIIDGVRYVPEAEEQENAVPAADVPSLKVFFDSIRPTLFSGSLDQAQVDGCELLLETCGQAGLSPFKEQAAYVLATAYHETGKLMRPVRETFASTNNAAISLLERTWLSGKLPWVRAPYWRRDANGKAWFGRGFVQLTHESNYRRMEDKLLALGIEHARVHEDPDLALEPVTSAAICVYGMRDGSFTGKRLSDYIDANHTDYRNARRIVNGTDRADMIANYAELFESAIWEALKA